MEKFVSACSNFNLLTANPLPFLSGNQKNSDELVEICSSLYMFIKSRNKSKTFDLFAKLHVNGFDDEQIWQQIDMCNNDCIQICSKGAALCLNNRVELYRADRDHSGSSSPVDNSMSDSTEDDKNEKMENNEMSDETAMGEKFEATEVDDEFFSLRQMEKFLEMEESEIPHLNSNEEIDYFAEAPVNNVEEENCENDNLFNDFSSSEHDDDALLCDKSNVSLEYSNNQSQSARSLKYDNYFSSQVATSDEYKLIASKRLTKYEKQQLEMSKRIEALEEQALKEKKWQMKGETVAANRPVNSLLEEVLTFEHSERPAPEITDEHTFDLEKLICQRIKDKLWNDNERKIREVKDPHEFKKNIVLDSDKSKLSLQDIYEKEYLAKLSQESLKDKDNPTHVELATLMKNLFHKLDALSNFHFRLPHPEPEIKVLTNLSSITMEEVQPVTHTDADQLAPEEIYEEKKLKGDLEKTTSDKKRDKRKKAAKQKVGLCSFLILFTSHSSNWCPVDQIWLTISIVLGAKSLLIVSSKLTTCD